MHLLYESESFIVMQVPLTDEEEELLIFGESIEEARMAGASPSVSKFYGFEIVNKRTQTELFLTADMAKSFEHYLNSWKQQPATSSEVEAVLDSFTQLAQIPIVLH